MSIFNSHGAGSILKALVCFSILFTATTQDLRGGPFRERPATRNAFRPPPLLFLIADTHCQYDAQTNIREILNRLWSAGLIRTVFLEGNSVVVNTSLFAAVPSESIKKEMIDRLLKKGLVTGAESFAIEKRTPLPLVGIEDPLLYAKSRRLLRKVFQNRESIRRKKNRLEERLARLELAQFNPALREFKNTDLSLDVLKLWADKARISLDSFPTLFARRRGRAAANGSAPNNLDLFSLSEEWRAAKELIETSLARTRPEKEVIELGRYVDLLTRLCMGEITPDEWEKYQRIRKKWISIDKGVRRRDPVIVSTLIELDEERRDMEAFYALARDRDLAMARNMGPFPERTKNAACVVGGFHVASIKRLAEERGIETHILIPTTSGSNERETYVRLIKSASGALAVPSLLETKRFRRQFLSAALRLFWEKQADEPVPLNEKVHRLRLFIDDWKQSYTKSSDGKFPYSLRLVRLHKKRLEAALESERAPFLIRLRIKRSDENKSPAQKWPRDIRRLLTAQSLLGLSFHASFYMVHLLNEGYTLSSLARFFAFFSPAYLAGSVLLAVMAGRWGKKRVLVASFILNATGTLCLAFAGISPALLLISQVLGAFSLAGYSVTLHSLIYERLHERGQAESFQRTYGRAMQWFWIWAAVASVSGGWMVCWIPFPVVIIFSALVSLGLAGLIGAGPPTDSPPGAPTYLTNALNGDPKSTSSYLKVGQIIFSDKRLRPFIIFSLFVNGFFLGSVDFLTQPLLNDAGLPVFFFGYLSVAMSLSHALSSRYADQLNRLIFRSGARSAYFLMMLIFLIGFAFSDNLLCWFAFLLAANFWQGLLFVAGPALVHENLQNEHRSRWCSLWNILCAGTSVVNLILLSELLNWMSPLPALALLLVGALAASVLMRK